eukprot:39798_1
MGSSLNLYVMIRLLLMGISIFWLIPATSIILYYYCKNRNNINGQASMFKAGFCYFLSILLFCINYCINLSYECVSDTYNFDNIFLLTGTFFYGTHLILLIVLLFARVYFIFVETAYALSHTSIWIFISLCIFEIFTVAIYVLLTTTASPHAGLTLISYFIGVVNMLIIVLWITILYVYKLFQIIANSANSCNPITEKLLTNVTKHTVLALIWISTSICFWCIPFVYATRPNLNFDTYLLLHHGFILLDVNTNGFTFVLGFQFAHKIYMKCCSCTHNKFKKRFKKLVKSVAPPDIPTKNEIYISQIVMPQKPKLTIAEHKVWSTSSAASSTITDATASVPVTPMGVISHLPTITITPNNLSHLSISLDVPKDRKDIVDSPCPSASPSFSFSLSKSVEKSNSKTPKAMPKSKSKSN